MTSAKVDSLEPPVALGLSRADASAFVGVPSMRWSRTRVCRRHTKSTPDGLSDRELTAIAGHETTSMTALHTKSETVPPRCKRNGRAIETTNRLTVRDAPKDRRSKEKIQ